MRPLPDQVFPALKGLGKAHPYDAIHQWLCNALGAHPDQLNVTDPVQQLQVTVDIRPLIRILGGEWETMLQRAVAVKDQNSSGASKRGIQTEGEEGNFLASLGKLTGKKSAPAEGAKEFTRSADIAMDVNAKAAEAERTPPGMERQPVDKPFDKATAPTTYYSTGRRCTVRKPDGFMCRCPVCAGNLFIPVQRPSPDGTVTLKVLVCSGCGDETPFTVLPQGHTLEFI